MHIQENTWFDAYIHLYTHFHILNTRKFLARNDLCNYTFLMHSPNLFQISVHYSQHRANKKFDGKKLDRKFQWNL